MSNPFLTQIIWIKVRKHLVKTKKGYARQQLRQIGQREGISHNVVRIVSKEQHIQHPCILNSLRQRYIY